MKTSYQPTKTALGVEQYSCSKSKHVGHGLSHEANLAVADRFRGGVGMIWFGGGDRDGKESTDVYKQA